MKGALFLISFDPFSIRGVEGKESSACDFFFWFVVAPPVFPAFFDGDVEPPAWREPLEEGDVCPLPPDREPGGGELICPVETPTATGRPCSIEAGEVMDLRVP